MKFVKIEKICIIAEYFYNIYWKHPMKNEFLSLTIILMYTMNSKLGSF